MSAGVYRDNGTYISISSISLSHISSGYITLHTLLTGDNHSIELAVTAAVLARLSQSGFINDTIKLLDLNSS